MSNKTVEQIVEEMKSDATLYVKSDDKNYEASGALLDYAESILSAHRQALAEALADPTFEETRSAAHETAWLGHHDLMSNFVSRRRARLVKP